LYYFETDPGVKIKKGNMGEYVLFIFSIALRPKVRAAHEREVLPRGDRLSRGGECGHGL